MKVAQIVNGLVGGKGVTPERIAKAKALCLRSRRPLEAFEEMLADALMTRGVVIHPKAIEEAHTLRVTGLGRALAAMQVVPEGEKKKDQQTRERALAYLEGAIQLEKATHQQWRDKR